MYKKMALAWAVLILALSCLPSRNLPPTQIQYFDKIIHFVFYWILTLLTIFSIKNNGKLNTIQFIVSFLITFFYGIFIEILQKTLPIQRSFDMYDILTNAVGAIIAIFSVKIDLIK